MKEIKLTQNKVALVDDADFEWLNKFRWSAHKDNNTFYAVRHTPRDKNYKQKTIKMHRLILGLLYRDRKLVDHRDGNGLNNQRDNLRICTHSENAQNKISRYGTSRFKGVCWHKKDKKWQASIVFQGRTTYLGQFDSEVQAAKIYDKKAIELFGKFAHLNLHYLNGVANAI